MSNRKYGPVLLLIFLLLFLPACTQSSSISSQDFPIGSLWEVPVDDSGEVDWWYASSVASEQHTGYTLAGENLEDYAFEDVISSEGNQQSDVQVAIRSMVEDDENPVVALIGATTNEVTIRAASLVNFFNVINSNQKQNAEGVTNYKNFSI